MVDGEKIILSNEFLGNKTKLLVLYNIYTQGKI